MSLTPVNVNVGSDAQVGMAKQLRMAQTFSVTDIPLRIPSSPDSSISILRLGMRDLGSLLLSLVETSVITRIVPRH
jgi:hypothetical protein